MVAYEVEKSRIVGMEQGMRWAMMAIELGNSDEELSHMADLAYVNWMDGSNIEAFCRGVLDVLGIHLGKEFVDGSV